MKANRVESETQAAGGGRREGMVGGLGFASGACVFALEALETACGIDEALATAVPEGVSVSADGEGDHVVIDAVDAFDFVAFHGGAGDEFPVAVGEDHVVVFGVDIFFHEKLLWGM